MIGENIQSMFGKKRRGANLKKLWLVICSVVFLFILGFIMYIYIGFNGNPFLKYRVAKDAAAFVATKYHQEVEIEAGTYNFQVGSYGAKLHMKAEPNVSFSVEQLKQSATDTIFVDTYPSALWSQEFKQQMQPLINKLYPQAVKKQIIAIMSEDYYDEKAGKVPPLSDALSKVRVSHGVFLDTTYSLTDQNEKIEKEKVYEIIKTMQQMGLHDGELMIRYNYPDSGPNHEKVILVDHLDLIHSPNDLIAGAELPVVLTPTKKEAQ